MATLNEKKLEKSVNFSKAIPYHPYLWKKKWPWESALAIFVIVLKSKKRKPLVKLFFEKYDFRAFIL